MSIKAAQIKAARTLLGWSRGNLADRAGTTTKTISYYERGFATSDHVALVRIRTVLVAAGVEFIAESGEGTGVRLRKGGK